MSAAAKDLTLGEMACEIGLKGDQVAKTIQLVIDSIQDQPEAEVLMLVQDNIRQMCGLAEQLEIRVTS